MKKISLDRFLRLIDSFFADKTKYQFKHLPNNRFVVNFKTSLSGNRLYKHVGGFLDLLGELYDT